MSRIANPHTGQGDYIEAAELFAPGDIDQDSIIAAVKEIVAACWRRCGSGWIAKYTAACCSHVW